MKKIIALFFITIMGLSSCGSGTKSVEFTEKIYESHNRVVGNTNIKVQYCVKEPEKYNFYYYEYDEDAVFTHNEIEQLTNGFSFIEENVFEKGDIPFYSGTKKAGKVYKKDDIQLVLLDDMYFYILPSCPFCSSDIEYDHTQEVSKKLYDELKTKIGFSLNEKNFVFSKYNHGDFSEGESCDFGVFKTYDGVICEEYVCKYFHERGNYVLIGQKEKISKSDKITERIITGSELVEVFENRLTNSSIYGSSEAPAAKFSCQLYIMSNYNEKKEEREYNLEWVIVKNDISFDFCPIFRVPNYISFNAITGELNESLKDIW